ncbi:MAG TPA: hypothetical protein VFA11_09165 [Acidimicrobiales bacterium]|nr:hypothetical protein [Acidimicrobiales bacterium]
MTRLAAYGIAVTPPAGWDVRIYRRPAADGETTHTVMHAANFPLPAVRADYGGGAVERMGPAHAFVALLEFHPDDAGSPLFSRQGIPEALDPDRFDPTTLQRQLPGQAGAQSFFSARHRCFCLYVVLGSYTRRAQLVAEVNRLLPTVTVAGPVRAVE